MDDVFLVHSSRDKVFVRQLRDLLQRENLTVWFDEDRIPPTSLFNVALTKGIAESKTVAICIGPSGIGPVQRDEIDLAIRESQFAEKPIMSIVLPGAKDEDRPGLLRGRPLIVFKQSPSEQEAIDRIIWGVTGTKPSRSSRIEAAKPKPAVESEDPIEKAVGRVCSSRRNSELVFVFGPYSALMGADDVPGLQQISRDLLKSILPALSECGPWPSFEDVGSCVAIRDGLDSLEAQLCEQFPPIRGRIPAVYRTAAGLVRRLVRGAQERARTSSQPVILLTTNIDTALEQALLCEGVSMLRIVCDLPRECLRVNSIRATKLEDGTLSLNSLNEDDVVCRDENDVVQFIDGLPANAEEYNLIARAGGRDVESLSFAGATGAVVFKYHGSRGFIGSCATTAERYFRLAAYQGLVPRKMRERLANSPTILLGCGILSSTFQQLYAAILRDAFNQVETSRLIVYDNDRLSKDQNWVLEVAAGNKLQDQITRMNMMYLDMDPEDFLQRLSAKI
jgi:hypothetical protein